VAAREAKKEEKALAIRGVQVATPATNGKLAEVNNDRLAIKAAKQGQLVTIHRQKPEATITELASLLDVSRGTIRNYGKELGLEFATNGKNGARQ
jgi:predicted transcriptional regulator